MKEIFNTNYLTLLIFLLSSALAAQNETKIWYFGVNAGLDFNTSPPTILTNGVMSTPEGCASASDAQGNLLFYTNGVTIWDKTHAVMANGNGLQADVSSTQACLIVKKPESLSNYYVFSENHGLYYSEINMSFASGNGSVTVKNMTVFATGSEKLVGTRHCNGKDVWVVTHDYGNNNFRANLVTSSGINSTAIISSIGSIIGAFNDLGCMKISPNGKKIGMALWNLSAPGSFELYDFNNSTGVVTNSVLLGNTFTQPYGCEFSPDSKKFYGSGAINGSLVQWDLSSGVDATTIASQQLLSTSTQSTMGTMQLAPNGKIYIANVGQESLGVINFPDIGGINCSYSPTGQSISPNSNNNGLPNIIGSYFTTHPTITLNSSANNFSMCVGESKTLSVVGANTYTWNSTIFSQSLTITPPITSTYSVSGTNTLGCAYELTSTIAVTPCTMI